MSKLREQVSEFHQRFGVPEQPAPTVPTWERCELRVMLIAEEFLELCAALGYHPKLTLDRQVTPFPREHVYLPEVADALADLDYVIEGTRLEFGIDGGPIADAVHAANMRKVGGPTRADGKILKPDEWEPPDIAGELKKQGWDG